ncbi:MAG TPA: hypothetical protein VIS03_14130 [Kiloniellaceae bacterium]
MYEDGSRIVMPTEPSQITYYAHKTVLQDGRTLADLIGQVPFGPMELGEGRSETLKLNPAQRMKPPDEYFFVSGLLAAIECGAVCRLVHSITGDTAVDPGVFTYPIVYTNAVTGEASRFNLDRLPLGPKRLLPGHFYFSPHPLMYWYCANVVGSEMTLHLVECFQLGEKLSTTARASVEYSCQYILVTDRNLLDRLGRRLDDYLAMSGQET